MNCIRDRLYSFQTESTSRMFSEGMVARNIFRQCLRYVLQLLLLCTVGLFFVYLSAISLNAWWLSRVQKALGKHLSFPYLSPYVAKRFDKADKYFEFPLSEDLALAVSLPLSLVTKRQFLIDCDTHGLTVIVPVCCNQSTKRLVHPTGVGFLGPHISGISASPSSERRTSPQTRSTHQARQTAKAAAYRCSRFLLKQRSLAPSSCLHLRLGGCRR